MFIKIVHENLDWDLYPRDDCHSVEVLGPSVIRYGGNDKPILSCGARVVIETESEVKIIK